MQTNLRAGRGRPPGGGGPHAMTQRLIRPW